MAIKKLISSKLAGRGQTAMAATGRRFKAHADNTVLAWLIPAGHKLSRPQESKPSAAEGGSGKASRRPVSFDPIRPCTEMSFVDRP